MQLLRLELKGFKSFADKTIVKFSPGMTAVIGPNGSGKSNITDAMKWVLGESNVRNLRGQKAEDIIFSGTEKRKPMSAAEVTLVFDNSDQQLDIDMAEVAITRRIYRTGESEFLINKRSCRLKDIHLLLADTGLGRDSMAIIGQNRIDAILNSKPEERRLIFEDVAGISRFKINKEDALRRIASTDRNMERVRDVMATIEEQLGPLSEKAEKTKKYMTLSRAKRDYDGALGFHNYKTSDRLLTRFENDNIAFKDEEIELQTELSKLEARRHELQSSSSKEQEQLKLWEAQYTEKQRDEERLSGHLRLLEEQLKTARRELDETSMRISELEATQKGEEQQLRILNQLIQDESAQLVEKESNLEELEASYKKAVEDVRSEQAKFQSLQSNREAFEKRQLEVVSAIETAKASIRSLEARKGESKNQCAILESEIAQVDSELQVARSEFEALGQKFNALSAQRQALVDDAKDAVMKAREERKELQKLRTQEQRAKGRLELLAQWEEQHEGYLEGTKNILNGKGSWREQITGAVGDLFTVEEKYTTAIETALGGSVNHVVTTTARAAAEGVNYLKSIQGGRVTFLPMDSVKGKPYDTPALHESCVLGTAVDCISFDNKYAHIFQYLLGRTLVVSSMDDAIGLQKKYNQQLRIVTLTGEQFQPGGSLTGGATKRKRASVLSRKEEAASLEQELVQIEGQIRSLIANLESLEKRVEETEKDQATLDESYQHTNLLYVASETKVQNIQNQLDRKKRVLHEEEQRLVQIDIDLATTTANLKDQETALASLQEDHGMDGNQGALMGRLTVLQKVQQEAYEAFTEARLTCDTLRHTIQERESQREQRNQSISSIIERLTPLRNLLVSTTQRYEEDIPLAQEVAEQELTSATAEVERLRALRDEAYDKTSTGREEMESILSEQDRLNQRYKVVQGRLVDMEGKITRHRMDCERFVEELQELGFTLEDAQVLRIEGSVSDWKDEQARLIAEIAELGPVNPNAVEEYEETKERYDFLTTQLADLDTAKAQLQAVIAEMDKAMSTQLYDVLDVVGRRFQEVFSQLFGGGTAQIVLTDPDNILTGGIDFYIQPPGKKRQQLTLLSGGERALTVIALLFSFLDYRPAPFCVLDEVDAALDEANVERFSSYLNRINKETQFIVVSHRKKTMEAAEVLQGVTMVERGVSRLLTVAFEDVKEDLA
ncbi:chromosome segregation protein SMC [Veillonella parvula DSM 2008]|uniref:chromosome segregation protein SMC n=1 Tax=Veillonella parvula TaxID=29466 RepID=UPI00019D639F|nr:chromosome segregation protein SMC [Veillonella parvula]ACZ24388.1 chromosome segregation protein SMC [Veillonella parvula DSM 2008]QQB16348.1 chromosome segregation protein SMC [Veillonella parvula]SNU96337.1 Chromosome partition protein Smc [Veillonella parvula]